MGGGRRAEQAGGMDKIRSSFARQGLIRPSDRRILGGVCAGVGHRLGLTPTVSRLLFMLLLLLPGSQLLVYPVLWILMPDEQDVTHPARVATYPAV
jgi:phage shock protein C